MSAVPAASLWVVCPVYNEAESIAGVVAEWVPALTEATGGDFVFCLLNDGSKDETLTVLENLARQYPQLDVVDKPNSGHGQTCLMGYQRALAAGATWVFQIDSDGQCDPAYFMRFWQARETYPVIYGLRYRRDDGLLRFLISRVVTLLCLIRMGVWLPDANVPYRLMHRDRLAPVVARIGPDFHLVNILLACLQQRQPGGIHWIPIRFRDRAGGSPSINGMAFVRHALTLFKQLGAYASVR